MEAQIALDALASTTPAVIGPAASTIEVDAVREALAHHLVVWLKAPASYLDERAVQKDHRPLLDEGDPRELFEQQLAVRKPLVLPLADLVLEVPTMSKDAPAEPVAAVAPPPYRLRPGPQASPSRPRPPVPAPE